MFFVWRNYKWKYICVEQKYFITCSWSCITSPSAEKSWFVKNTIYFPLKNSLFLQLIFCFVKPALSSWIHFISADTGWEKENMTELLHKPIGCGKSPEWNLNSESRFQINTAELSSSTCLSPPTSCFLSKNDLDHPHFVENIWIQEPSFLLTTFIDSLKRLCLDWLFLSAAVFCDDDIALAQVFKPPSQFFPLLETKKGPCRLISLNQKQDLQRTSRRVIGTGFPAASWMMHFV